MKKIFIFVFLLLPFASFENENPLIKYLEQKALCNYEKAMDIVEKWTMRIDDPYIIETNIFRINELVKYPELIDKAIGIFSRLNRYSAIKNDNFLKARIDTELNILNSNEQIDAV